jgi:hypothetical protein
MFLVILLPDGLDPLGCSHSELMRTYESYREFVGTHGLGIRLSQGPYLHR